MPVIDMHAHVTPQRFKDAIAAQGQWHGLEAAVGELGRGGWDKSLTERLDEMDQLGVDIQLVTPCVGFYQYHREVEFTTMVARECNDEIAEMVERNPDRFAGMATLPMQDPTAAITELERVVGGLGLRGAIINDHVVGKTYDEPEFLPFFAAAQDLGALLFFHQGGDTVVNHRIQRYKLANAVGNLTERALVFAALVFGGVLDRYPDLDLLLAHGGGYAPYGVRRMDKVAGAMPGDFDGTMRPPFPSEDGFAQEMAPSDYLGRFFYDCCTYDGPVLRFIIDTVGIDRVVLGTDYPAPMFLHDPVNWVRGLPELSETEKEAILTANPEKILAR